MPELSYIILHDDQREVQSLDYQRSGTFTPHDVFKLVKILESKGLFKVFPIFEKPVVTQVMRPGISDKML